MFCPVCSSTISTKRKKQIKHLYTHSSEDLAQTVLHLDRLLALHKEAQEIFPAPDSPAEQEGFADAGPWPAPGDVFSLVEVGPETSEEDSEEDSDDTYAWIDDNSDEAMGAAGMEQCAHCGLWVWPGDMPNHLDNTCPDLYQGEPDESTVQRPDPGAAYLTDMEDPLNASGDILAQGITIAADGPEATLLNALARFVKELPSVLHKDYMYYRWVWPGDMPYHLAISEPGRGDYAEVRYIRIAVDGPECQLLNALALYIRRTNGNG